MQFSSIRTGKFNGGDDLAQSLGITLLNQIDPIRIVLVFI